MLIRPINVNLSSGKVDSLDSLSNLLTLKERIESDLANQLYEKIATSAEATLVDTQERYLKGLSVEGGTIVLDTSDFVVHMVEEGNKPFDMKPGLLNSPNVKIGKDGQKYISVPLEKYRGGKYNWRDQNTGKFKASTTVGPVEFRIVSEKSDTDAWIHPGHIGNHFVDRAIENFDVSEVADQYIQEFIL